MIAMKRLSNTVLGLTRLVANLGKSICELSEYDVMAISGAYIYTNRFRKAGEILYKWLESNNSDSIADLLCRVTSMLYVREVKCYTLKDDDIFTSTESTYDQYGGDIRYVKTKNGHVEIERTRYYFYEGRTPVSYNEYDKLGTLIDKYRAVTDHRGKVVYDELTHVKDDSVIKCVYQFDRNGNMLYKNSVCVRDDEVLYSKCAYHEYEHGFMIKSKSYTDNTLMSTETCHYDNNGNIIISDNYDYQNGSKTRCLYNYDEYGRIYSLTKVTETGQQEWRYEYDKFGNIVKEKYIKDDTPVTMTVRTYNFMGKVVDTQYYDYLDEDSTKLINIREFCTYKYGLRKEK